MCYCAACVCVYDVSKNVPSDLQDQKMIKFIVGVVVV